MSKETLSTSEPKKTETPKHINALEEKYKEEATQEPHAKRLHLIISERQLKNYLNLLGLEF